MPNTNLKIERPIVIVHQKSSGQIDTMIFPLALSVDKYATMFGDVVVMMAEVLKVSPETMWSLVFNDYAARQKTNKQKDS